MRTQKLLLAIVFTVISLATFAQVGIGTITPDNSALLELKSTTKGLLIPRMSLSEMNDIQNPAEGLIVFNTSNKCFKGYQNNAWVDITNCSAIITPATITVANPTYQGISVINNVGIGYNGEAIPAASTITIDVTTDMATSYSFTASDFTTGLTYSASGNFLSAGTFTVILTHNEPNIPETFFGNITMPLTGASNTLNLVPRIDIKSIPASSTAIVDVTYGLQTWMDRNLGARRVATTLNDVLSYGNLYQWGRPADGHEISVVHGTTLTSGRSLANVSQLEALATTEFPGYPDYILTNAAPLDWLSLQNDPDRWAAVKQGPCPVGYHVPTHLEWIEADAYDNGGATNSGATLGWDNTTEAFESDLKLPSSGFHTRNSNNVNTLGTRGVYWASDVDGTNARHLDIRATIATPDNSTYRAFGFSVRCIKN